MLAFQCLISKFELGSAREITFLNCFLQEINFVDFSKRSTQWAKILFEWVSLFYQPTFSQNLFWKIIKNFNKYLVKTQEQRHINDASELISPNCVLLCTSAETKFNDYLAGCKKKYFFQVWRMKMTMKKMMMMLSWINL